MNGLEACAAYVGQRMTQPIEGFLGARRMKGQFSLVAAEKSAGDRRLKLAGLLSDIDRGAMQRDVFSSCPANDLRDMTELPHHHDHHEDESSSDDSDGGKSLF